MNSLSQTVVIQLHYSRTSMARTPMARLPRPFQSRSWVLRKNTLAADIIIFGIILNDFLF